MFPAARHYQKRRCMGPGVYCQLGSVNYRAKPRLTPFLLCPLEERRAHHVLQCSAIPPRKAPGSCKGVRGRQRGVGMACRPFS